MSPVIPSLPDPTRRQGSVRSQRPGRGWVARTPPVHTPPVHMQSRLVSPNRVTHPPRIAMADVGDQGGRAVSQLGALWPPTGASRVMVCSYGAAACATFVGYPLDTIKTRLQTYSYPNFWHAITETWREGGINAFYRGISASLISSSTARAFTMSLYTELLPRYQHLLGASHERAPPVTFLGGLTAGAASTVFTSPFEFTKVASQVESLVYRARGITAPRATGSIQAVKDLSRRGGFRQLYGGYRYHLMRDSLGSGIYFTVYEYAKASMGRILKTESGTPDPLSVVVAGGLCGVISWIAVYPIDTMKSEYQRDLYSHSLANSLEFRETIVQKPRFRLSLSMYRGLGFSVLRTCINGIALFSCFEYFMYLTQPKDENGRPIAG